MVRSAAIELTYKDPPGKPDVLLLYRDREPTLDIVEAGSRWSFDGDGKLFRLVCEAHRINLAHLFDPLLAIHTSMVEPLPHQITTLYGEMLPGSCSAATKMGQAAPSGELTFFEALDKQLGLRLQQQKYPMPVMVIDHAELPGEN